MRLLFNLDLRSGKLDVLRPGRLRSHHASGLLRQSLHNYHPTSIASAISIPRQLTDQTHLFRERDKGCANLGQGFAELLNQDTNAAFSTWIVAVLLVVVRSPNRIPVLLNLSVAVIPGDIVKYN